MKGLKWRWVVLPVLVVSAGFVYAAASDQVAKLLKQGDYREALQSADGEIKAGSTDGSIRFYRAVALAQLGQIDAAITEFAVLAAEQPRNPEPHNNLAVLYAQKGDYDKARSELEAALATHPSYATAHKNLGDLYAAMAAQAYNRALARTEQRNAPPPRLALLDSLDSPTPKLLQVPQAVAPVPVAPAQPLPVASAIASPAPAAVPPVAALPKPATPVTPSPRPTTQPPTPARPAPVPPATTTAAPPPAPRTRVTLSGDGPTMTSIPAPAAPVAAASPKPVPLKPVLAAAPATPPASPASSPDLQAQARDISQAVRNWGMAWADQNVSAYLAAYSSRFSPEGGMGRNEWEKTREERLTKPASIDLKLVDLQVKLQDENRAAARFIQVYKSESFEDTVEKRLDLVREEGAWKILREISGQRHH